MRDARRARAGIVEEMTVAGHRTRQGKLPTGKAQRAGRTRGERVPRIVRLSDIATQEVEWLWYPYIPRGKITLLEGDPGVGKSYLSLQLCAIISRGWPWPENEQPEGGRRRESAAVLNCDDGLQDTIRPRLESAGADLERVSAITGLSDGSGITLGDVDMLECMLVKLRPALVVVDPIQGFLGRINAHRANDVRPILAGLGSLAERYGTAVLCIRHLRKNGANRALYRGMGSIDFSAAARSVLLAGEKPDDPAQRAVVHLKSSLAPKGASIEYTLGNGGFKWIGVSDLTADDLLRPGISFEDRTALNEAREFLWDALAAGPAPVNDIKKQAKAEGISEKTLRRAKRKLGVRSHRRSVPGGDRGKGEWIWSVDAQDSHESGGGALGHVEERKGTEVPSPVTAELQDGHRGHVEECGGTPDSSPKTAELQGGRASRPGIRQP